WRGRGISQRRDDIEDDGRETCGNDDRAEAGDEVRNLPTEILRIGEDPARHAEEPGEMHRQEGDVEADEEEPEGNDPEPAREQFPEGEGEVVVESRHQRSEEHTSE